MRVKHAIDQQLAMDFGMTTPEVAKITEAFIDELRKQMTLHKEVTIDKLGKFLIKGSTSGKRCRDLTSYHGRKQIVAVPHQIRVHFSKSPTLKNELDKAHEEKRPNGKRKHK